MIDAFILFTAVSFGLICLTVFCWITENWMFYACSIVAVIAVFGLSMV